MLTVEKDDKPCAATDRIHEIVAHEKTAPVTHDPQSSLDIGMKIVAKMQVPICTKPVQKLVWISWASEVCAGMHEKTAAISP